MQFLQFCTENQSVTRTVPISTGIGCKEPTDQFLELLLVHLESLQQIRNDYQGPNACGPRTLYWWVQIDFFRECSYVLLLRINSYIKSVITMVGAFFGMFFGVIATFEMSWDVVDEWASCSSPHKYNFTCNQVGVLYWFIIWTQYIQYLNSINHPWPDVRIDGGRNFLKLW